MFVRVAVVLMPVVVVVLVRMFVRVFAVVAVRMLVRVLVRVVLLFEALFAPEFFARQLFFAGGDHVNFGRADAAAVHTGNLQASIHAQGLHGPGEDFAGNSGIDQRAKKHVAADSGETL